MEKVRIEWGRSKRRGLKKTFVIVALFMAILTGRTAVASVGDVSFRWQGNPADDHVIGYRLYYGGESRFNPNGTLKSNFSYDYYIDFAELERCTAASDYTECRFLGSEIVQCKDLYGNLPSCTVGDLYGRLYFALTAYNAQVESNYTPELNMAVNPGGMTAVQQAVTALLLRKKQQ